MFTFIITIISVSKTSYFTIWIFLRVNKSAGHIYYSITTYIITQG